jgi:hypothetical protein
MAFASVVLQASYTTTVMTHSHYTYTRTDTCVCFWGMAVIFDRYEFVTVSILSYVAAVSILRPL